MLTSAYNAPSNGQCERMVQEVKKIMEKTGERDPKFVMKVLNNTERPLPNSNNEDSDVQENLQRRIKMAERVAGRKGRFSRESFLEGDEVWIQNPANRKWDRKGIVTKVRKWNDTPLSFVVECDGKEYLRNGKFLCHTVPEGWNNDEP